MNNLDRRAGRKRSGPDECARLAVAEGKDPGCAANVRVEARAGRTTGRQKSPVEGRGPCPGTSPAIEQSAPGRDAGRAGRRAAPVARPAPTGAGRTNNSIDARTRGVEEDEVQTFLHPAVLDAVEELGLEEFPGAPEVATDATDKPGMEVGLTDDVFRAYLNDIGRAPVLSREAERAMAIAIARGRRRVRLTLFRDLDVVRHIVRLFGDASRGLLGIADILEGEEDDTPSGRYLLNSSVQHLARLRAQAELYERRASNVRASSPRGRALRSAEARARVRVGRFAVSLPFGDEFVRALLELVECGRLGTTVTRDRASRYAETERELRRRFVEANLRLVVSVAKPMARGGARLPDLVSEGNIGLMRAIDRYDPSRGLRFSTYATWLIRQAISRAKVGLGRVVRISPHVTELLGAVARARRELAQSLGHEPDAEAVAEACGVTLERVLEAMEFGRDVLSLDAPAGEFDGLTLGDTVEDPEALRFVGATEDAELRTKVSALLRRLPPGEEHVLRARFGLDGSRRSRSLAEIAARTGVSRERVRQIEQSAMAKLRASAAELRHLVRTGRDLADANGRTA